MPPSRVDLGLTLPNRGVLFGVVTPAELVDLAVQAEKAECFDSVWVGDSILAKPRLEALTLLAAVAARTTRVRVGSACLSSFALRHPILLADQWASLDLLAGGRTILGVCKGDLVGGGDLAAEWKALGVPIKMRFLRMEEEIQVVRRLFSEDNVTFEGKYYNFEDVTIAPKPDVPPPIWIQANPHTAGAGAKTIRTVQQRIARLADGWMTTFMTPAGFRESWEGVAAALDDRGRDPDTFPRSLYHNVNINEDKAWALQESKEFLQTYYTTSFTESQLDEMWVAAGSPAECADRINALIDAGLTGITLRITSWDQPRQFQRLVEEVVPLLQLRR